MKRKWNDKAILVAACAMTVCVCAGKMQAAAEGSVTASVESCLYGSAYTNGETTLKAEEEIHEVSYEESSYAVITLTTEDGSAIDDSLIDISNAYVTLDDGDGYYVDDLIFDGTALEGEFENGQLTYRLEEGDITWKNPEGYEVDNGGAEWSCQGGNGNGEYVFNLSVHNILYDGEEIEAASFRAVVYIYGREFSSTSSPDNPGGSRWGAGGYDSVELPLPEEKELTEEVETSETPVWTWVGADTYGKPIICDYSYYETDQEGNTTDFYDATDNFYISWPEGIDASALTDADVTITLYSAYGDEYVLTPNTGLKTVEENGEEIADGEYSVFAGEKTTQIAVNMVYWSYTPVYTTMSIVVNTENVSGYDTEVSYETAIGSVYTYMVQTGGGYDRTGTVTIQMLFGIENIDEIEYSDISGETNGYYYAYEEGEGMQKEELAYLIENEDGTYTVTENKEEATTYDEDRAPALIGNYLCQTGYPVTIECEYNGETVEFSKTYSGNIMVQVPDLETTNLVAADGYVLSQSMMWGEHMRWSWLYFNGVGWKASGEE
ncbi:MAG: hypothetical protein LUD18_04120 [Lachnospiraceae bacterium]|nr:hypothetical protein [Lachnospiraceae bacterium]